MFPSLGLGGRSLESKVDGEVSLRLDVRKELMSPVLHLEVRRTPTSFKNKS